MYSNLLDELNKKGISINAAAKIIDMPEATLRTKIQSRSFDVDEAFALRDNLFPEFDMRYLFKKDNTKSAWGGCYGTTKNSLFMRSEQK